MKTLFLVRHAKSDWSIPGLGDYDRPLNQRGYVDAHKMGSYLKTTSPHTLFVSSAAVRAISTALIIAKEINYPQEKISIHPELYEAEPNIYRQILKSADDRFESLYIFGHNPTISLVIGMLSGTNIDEVPTCSVTILKFNTAFWNETISSKGSIVNQLYPKSLTE